MLWYLKFMWADILDATLFGSHVLVDLMLRYLTKFRCDDALTLISSTLVGEEKIRLQANQSDEAWEIHKRLASELEVNLPNLQLVLPDGQLLANFCRAHPGATLADVKRTNRTI